ncbi:MAG: hypothetical protein ACREGG_03620 [Candidatus Saccharimonadales bacterium]
MALVLFIVFLVVILTHGHKTPAPPAHVMTLPDYANTTASVVMTTDGIVNGDDIHRQIRITVAQDRRLIEIIQGYSGQVISSNTFYNTNDAFAVFLRAINNSGFLAKAKPKKGTSIPSDERGQCPVGFRYTFELSNEGSDVSRLWTSSCATGNWGGNLATEQQLFQDQIPNYGTLTENVNLEATNTQ